MVSSGFWSNMYRRYEKILKKFEKQGFLVRKHMYETLKEESSELRLLLKAMEDFHAKDETS